MAIQGFGNVGAHAAKFLHDCEFPIVAVSDITGTYYHPDGLNVPELLHHKLTHPRGLLEGYCDCQRLETDALLELDDVQVLIPAALGGVTVSYFEWVQNRQHYRWPLDRVRQELDHMMNEAFEEVWQTAQQHDVTLRTAAYIIGITRVRRAAELAGLTT